MKLTKKEIDAIARPFTDEEAVKEIGRIIKKRPGVFADDDGSEYKILGAKDGAFQFLDDDGVMVSYRYENIIYDYVFDDETLVGAYK